MLSSDITLIQHQKLNIQNSVHICVKNMYIIFIEYIKKINNKYLDKIFTFILKLLLRSPPSNKED